MSEGKFLEILRHGRELDPGYREDRQWDSFISHIAIKIRATGRPDSEIHSFSHWAIMTRATRTDSDIHSFWVIVTDWWKPSVVFIKHRCRMVPDEWTQTGFIGHPVILESSRPMQIRTYVYVNLLICDNLRLKIDSWMCIIHSAVDSLWSSISMHSCPAPPRKLIHKW